MSLQGTRLGRYLVGEVIGIGGFASVYQAFDEGLEANVAVKVLAENHSLIPDTRERFLSEGRFLRRVDHPNVLRVYDVGETDALQPYLVLQLAEAGSLRQRLESHPADLTTADIETVADALEAGLTALHDAGLVHRDLSPDNVFLVVDGDTSDTQPNLIDHNERVVIGDLGLAKDLARASGLTMGGGTGDFASPEQRTAFGQVSPASDVYGASALLSFVVRGTPMETTVKSRVARGLSPNPERRPQTIREWRTELGQLTQQVRGPMTSTQQSAGRSDPSAPNAPRARTGLVFAACALVVLLLATGLLLRGLRSGDLAATETASPTTPGSEGLYPADLEGVWANSSWGDPVPFDLGLPAVDFTPYAALSLSRSEPLGVTTATHVVFRFDGLTELDVAPQLGVRATGDGEGPGPVCKVADTDHLRGDELVIPVALLSNPATGLLRVSLLETGGADPPPFDVLEISITDDPPFRPSDSCAS